MLTGIVAVSVWLDTDADTEMLNVLVVDAVNGPVEAIPDALVVTKAEAVPPANDADPPLSWVTANVTTTPATGRSLESVIRITDSELTMFCVRLVGLAAADRISIR
jgi:hypothetical protein